MAESAPKPVGEPSAPAKTGSTVIVACRIPHGMVLRIFDMIEVSEPSPMGFKTVKQAEQIQGDDTVFVARGPGRTSLTGLLPDQIDGLNPGGYALTQGCPVDLWNRWINDNRKTPYVLREDIFAEPSMERARNHAISRAKGADKDTGLEPIDPENPGKRVRGEGGLKIERGERPSGVRSAA